MTEFTIQTIDGMDCIVIQQGNAIHQIGVQALSNWGVLLGTTNTEEILEAILKEGSMEKDLINWGELYDALGENLDELSRSGVPVEFAEMLMDPEFDSPVPGQERVARLERARSQSKRAVGLAPDGQIVVDAAMCADIVGEISSQEPERLETGRLEFIDQLAPVYEVVTDHEGSSNFET